MKTAAIICNGPSRENLDLKIFDNITTFGCNAVYRDYAVNYHVCIDYPVYEELIQALPSKEHDNIIIANEEEQFEPANKPGVRAKNNAGVFALDQAVSRGYNNIIVVGMDCIVAEGDSLGNIYLGSKNFPDKVSFDDQRRRLFYLDWFCQQHPNVKFTFSFPDEIKKYNRIEAKNVVGLTFSKLKEKLNAR